MNKKNIILKSGRVVTHHPMGNGATDASMTDDGTMSNSEWEEYCAILAKRNAAKIKTNARRRANDAAMRDCGLTKVKGALGGTYWE